jgi:hypothetical protein
MGGRMSVREVPLGDAMGIEGNCELKNASRNQVRDKGIEDNGYSGGGWATSG